MTSDPSPVDQPPAALTRPDPRASDADRERVVAALGEASADGRLTPKELGERLESALVARTHGELAALTADLGPAPGRPPEGMLQAKRVIRIDQRFGSLARTGRWVVPQRFDMRPKWCDVTLDFTDAVINQSKLSIDLSMKGGSLILVTRPGIVVDTSDLRVRYTEVNAGPVPDPDAQVLLYIELAGRMRFGRIETLRSPRPAES
ncbi:MAG TPA: DUF1707 domain-containing protein [Actinocrinis sp.]